MVLMRRYRVFLAFAAIATLALLQFMRMREWNIPSPLPAHPVKEQSLPKGPSSEDLVAPPSFVTDDKTKSKPKPAADNTDDGTTKGSSGLESLFGDSTAGSSSKSGSKSGSSSGSDSGSASNSGKNKPDKSKQGGDSSSGQTYNSWGDEFAAEGHGRYEVDTSKVDMTEIHWEKQPEHFPLDEDDMIKLPTGQTKEIPKIQYNFSPESNTLKKVREKRMLTIKESFENSWDGYKETAWGHDELMPVTGGYRDPFSGWGATLVDSLDTLWIMGMKEEFEDAVKQVQKIDFTTTFRKDIPLFETVIRYLGGLIAAYDVTDGQYVVLLDKAVELADILMGAFDTPNRMPMTYYNWAPAYASQPHRAGTRVVVAELGSLSMEFTRLAQLTKKDKYYDAIARITDALEEYQMHTNLPGLWPTHVDASGCKKPEEKHNKVIEHAQKQNSDASNDKTNAKGGAKASNAKREEYESDGSVAGDVKTKVGSSSQNMSKGGPKDSSNEGSKDTPKEGSKNKPNKPSNNVPDGSPANLVAENPSLSDCEKQGLSSPPGSTDKFTLGALADSAYEYLPKEYLLLGGLKDQYRKMYELSMDTVRKYLLYRPMVKDNRNILFAASATSSEAPETIYDLEYKYEGSHLGCFAGGMFGMGAKMFNIKGDLQIASKLTDACVWAYQSTATGIMPESFELMPCQDNEKCDWDEKKYRNALDPYEDSRTEEAVSRLSRDEIIQKIQDKKEEEEIINTSKDSKDSKDSKGSSSSSSSSSKYPPSKDTTHAKRKIYKSPSGKYLGKPDMLSHEDFVDARIREERLPDGFTEINSRKYILRPEAIESVFIMYRITGDDYWREKAWGMFQSIEKYTRTPLGNSAINDVTSEAPLYMDQMESFWLGETLKYFYLLFSHPSVISLDDYVLNTEAHPFKRPE